MRACCQETQYSQYLNFIAPIVLLLEKKERKNQNKNQYTMKLMKQ